MRKITSTTLLFAALAVSACGGAAQPAASTAPTQAAASAAATTAATTAPTTAPSAAASADQDKALLDLLRARSAQYKVTYDFTLSNVPTGKQQLTQYFKSPSFRQDITTSVGGQNQTFITIISPQGTFSCGAFGPQGNACINFGALAGGLTPPSGAPTTGTSGGAGSAPQGAPTDLTGFNLAFTSTKTVAGQSTRCYNFTGSQTAGVEITGCYSSQGIPLYIATKASTFTSEMIATQFSTNVTDADFALPYPISQIPGFPAPSRP
jgi:hypothetical protein